MSGHSALSSCMKAQDVASPTSIKGMTPGQCLLVLQCLSAAQGGLDSVGEETALRLKGCAGHNERGKPKKRPFKGQVGTPGQVARQSRTPADLAEKFSPSAFIGHSVPHGRTLKQAPMGVNEVQCDALPEASKIPCKDYIPEEAETLSILEAISNLLADPDNYFHSITNLDELETPPTGIERESIQIVLDFLIEVRALLGKGTQDPVTVDELKSIDPSKYSRLYNNLKLRTLETITDYQADSADIKARLEVARDANTVLVRVLDYIRFSHSHAQVDSLFLEAQGLVNDTQNFSNQTAAQIQVAKGHVQEIQEQVQEAQEHVQEAQGYVNDTLAFVHQAGQGVQVVQGHVQDAENSSLYTQVVLGETEAARNLAQGESQQTVGFLRQAQQASRDAGAAKDKADSYKVEAEGLRDTLLDLISQGQARLAELDGLKKEAQEHRDAAESAMNKAIEKEKRIPEYETALIATGAAIFLLLVLVAVFTKKHFSLKWLHNAQSSIRSFDNILLNHITALEPENLQRGPLEYMRLQLLKNLDVGLGSPRITPQERLATVQMLVGFLKGCAFYTATRPSNITMVDRLERCLQGISVSNPSLSDLRNVSGVVRDFFQEFNLNRSALNVSTSQLDVTGSTLNEGHSRLSM